MANTLTLAYFAAKGGQGTTVIAASVALTHAKTGRRTLLIDAAEHHDTYAALGCPEPAEPNTTTPVVPNLDLVAIDPDNVADEIDTTGYEVAVIDFTPANDPPITAPNAESSSSVCTRRPPIFGSHSPRKWRTSDDGVIG